MRAEKAVVVHSVVQRNVWFKFALHKHGGVRPLCAEVWSPEPKMNPISVC